MAARTGSTARSTTAARRVERLYIGSQDDPRYRENMFGEDPKGRTKATGGSIEPMRKIANAKSIAYDADRADYLAETARKGRKRK